MKTKLRQGRIAASFEEFHKENPHVYKKLRDLALELVGRGHAHYSMKGLFEIVRWHHALKTTGPFKLNNNYTAFYARMLMDREPILASFFMLRTSPNFDNTEV